MKSIVEVLAYRAKEMPNKICLIEPRRETSYKELYAMAIGFAEHLQSLGIQKGDCVVIQATKKASFIGKVMGIHLIGASSVPVEDNCPDNRILELIDSVCAKVYVRDKQLLINEQWVDVNQDFYGDVSKKTAFPNENWIGDIIFTTGTTGKSKGVMIAHKSLVAAVENVSTSVELSSDDKVIIPTPFNHAHALRRTYATIMTGSTAILMNGVANLKKLFQYLDEQVTGIYLMPAMLSMILKLTENRLAVYSGSLRFLELGSAPLQDDDRQKVIMLLPHTRINMSYGATESGCTSAYDMMEEGYIPLCVGKPTKHARFFFVDEEGNYVSATKDNPGYIVTEGNMNMAGYYNEPDLTREVLREGKVYSNDIGYQDEKGYIYFLGRSGDVINMGGIKISSLEIEQVVLRWEHIEECACVPLEDNAFGQVPVLFIVLKDKEKYDRKEFEKYLKKELEFSRLPKRIIEIEELPKTFNGKIKKKELRDML